MSRKSILQAGFDARTRSQVERLANSLGLSTAATVRMLVLEVLAARKKQKDARS